MSRPIAAAFVPMHRWGGLIFGWILFGVFLTGAFTVYMSEISYWATPSLQATKTTPREQVLSGALRWLENNASDARIWRVTFPAPRQPAIGIIYRTDEESRVLHLHPETLQVVRPHGEGGKLFFGYHYSLNVPRKTNPVFFWTVAGASIFFIVASIAGIVIRGRMLKNLFRPKLSGRTSRLSLDVHLLTGILPLIFHVTILYSGLLLIYWTYMPAGVDAVYSGNAGVHRKEIVQDGVHQTSIPAGSPVKTIPIHDLLQRAETIIGEGNASHFFVRDPGLSTMAIEFWRRRDDTIGQQVERVLLNGTDGHVIRHLKARSQPLTLHSIMAGLHMAEFAGPALRLVYFFCSLSGAVLVGTGLLRFISKRTPKDRPTPQWVKIITHISIATTTGLGLALAGYMLSLRFPIAADTSAYIFCGVWMMSLLHSFLRPPVHAIQEQLKIIALLCVLAVIGGAFPPHHPFWSAAANGDWMRFGVDAGLTGFAATAIFMARIIRQRIQSGSGTAAC